MELFYCKLPRGNFGDDLNLWLWDAILPGWHGMGQAGDTLFGAGTLLSEGNLRQFPRPIVLGSGTGYGASPIADTLSRCDIRAVRGPLTARRLGLPETMPMLDPAVLCPDFLDLPDLPSATNRVIFVPHHTTAALSLRWARLCDAAGIEYVSPEGDSQQVIARIARADLVIAESMHAAILADAFRVPWSPVQLSDAFNPFKWNDWAQSLEMEATAPDLLRTYRWIFPRGKEPSVRPEPEAPASLAMPARTGARQRLKRLLERLRPLVERQIREALRQAKSHPTHLSETTVLAARKAQLRAEIERVGHDYL
ncbi:polysaccharide pyruvyl transferase family protein [Tropicimonas sp. TH_r6]|uniref:polysaccharide pyruvyl transferase family protein n=1 Tax=Tropicimonas sp. TH_r6 TaxID=3082085 RepID=UPI0029535BBB|nr:polysaccharide pyruvyl transferase family protein [Tropicimonas sp. TH_r6]MDV7141183.1 polysaccharide pyruvyl transferase family protein [Tropicimonas sp. TH_r6]